MHVIAVHLPEAGAVLGHKLDAAHPLRALPEVQLRDHAAQWASRAQAPAARRRDACANSTSSPEQFLERDVRGVSAVGMEHHVPRLRPWAVASAITSRKRTPTQSLSYLLHVVTQWMSVRQVDTCGSAMNCSQLSVTSCSTSPTTRELPRVAAIDAGDARRKCRIGQPSDEPLTRRQPWAIRRPCCRPAGVHECIVLASPRTRPAFELGGPAHPTQSYAVARGQPQPRAILDRGYAPAALRCESIDGSAPIARSARLSVDDADLAPSRLSTSARTWVPTGPPNAACRRSFAIGGRSGGRARPGDEGADPRVAQRWAKAWPGRAGSCYSITHVENSGAAFGMLQAQQPICCW